MKNKKMIVFLIINIILIGIICSLISIKKNLIKEKQVIKEMRESTQISDLQNQINQLNASQEEYAKNIQRYKAKLATAITNQKVTTSENATIDEMVTNIGNILQARTKDATATADNITAGKTAYINGELITGNGADNNSYYTTGANSSIVGIYDLAISCSIGDTSTLSVTITNNGVKYSDSVSGNISGTITKKITIGEVTFSISAWYYGALITVDNSTFFDIHFANTTTINLELVAYKTANGKYVVGEN